MSLHVTLLLGKEGPLAPGQRSGSSQSSPAPKAVPILWPWTDSEQGCTEMGWGEGRSEASLRSARKDVHVCLCLCQTLKEMRANCEVRASKGRKSPGGEGR